MEKSKANYCAQWYNWNIALMTIPRKVINGVTSIQHIQNLIMFFFYFLFKSSTVSIVVVVFYPFPGFPGKHSIPL